MVEKNHEKSTEKISPEQAKAQWIAHLEKEIQRCNEHINEGLLKVAGGDETKVPAVVSSVQDIINGAAAGPIASFAAYGMLVWCHKNADRLTQDMINMCDQEEQPKSGTLPS